MAGAVGRRTEIRVFRVYATHNDGGNEAQISPHLNLYQIL